MDEPGDGSQCCDEVVASGRQSIPDSDRRGGDDPVPADATAYAWRDANFSIATLGGGSADFEKRWEELIPLFGGMYLSFETDTGPDTVARAYPPAHLRRLRDLKRQWDPRGLFRDNFFIDPTADDGPH